MRIRALALAFILILTATAANASNFLAPFTQSDIPAAPDFGQQASWLALPAAPGEHPVDIFWVYPTILADNEHWLMPITDKTLHQLATNTITKQASVFTGQANLYAPLYRQMNMQALSLPADEQEKLFKHGLEDVWKAFTHYLKYYNNGRPFIIAGHSQGSDIMLNLLLKHWGALGVERQLVAAYLIGWSITKEDVKQNPNLALCESATQTGCFITYNTMAAGKQSVAPTLRKGSLATNPLTWKTTNAFAPASENLGAVFFMDDGTTKHISKFTSAQIVDGGLVVNPLDPTLVTVDSKTFPEGVYHPFDYSLFYDNLKQNAVDRIKAFSHAH